MVWACLAFYRTCKFGDGELWWGNNRNVGVVVEGINGNDVIALVWWRTATEIKWWWWSENKLWW